MSFLWIFRLPGHCWHPQSQSVFICRLGYIAWPRKGLCFKMKVWCLYIWKLFADLSNLGKKCSFLWQSIYWVAGFWIQPKKLWHNSTPFGCVQPCVAWNRTFLFQLVPGWCPSTHELAGYQGLRKRNCAYWRSQPTQWCKSVLTCSWVQVVLERLSPTRPTV